MLEYVYLNGEILSCDRAALRLTDLSILRGYGVFDYLRYTADGPRFLADHLTRFRDSAAGLGLVPPVGEKELRRVILELIARNDPDAGGIRMVLTGGYSEDGYTPTEPNLMVLPYAYTPPRRELFKSGCAVMLHAYERQLPRVKSIDYIEGIRIQSELKRRGADYPLYVDHDGNVRESDRSNYMIVKNGILITPKNDILLGITRKHVLRLARRLDIPVEERTISVEDLLDADEALICSSVKGIMPIRRVDDHDVGAGAGAVVGRLMKEWGGYVTTDYSD